MAQLITAPLSRKAQLTLPKRIREFLGVQAAGDLVGFVLDEAHHRITLTKVDLVQAEDSWTDEELRKLVKLTKARGGKTFHSAETFLKHLRTL